MTNDCRPYHLFKLIRASLSVLILLLFFNTGILFAAPGNSLSTDSLMKHFFYNSLVYKNYIKEYTADVYIKATTVVPKKNILIRFAQNFSNVDQKGESTFFESICQLHYFTPDIFVQKIIALNGTNFNIKDMDNSVLGFTKLNIYNTTSFNNEILMPTTKEGSKYYSYSCKDTIPDFNGSPMIKIKLIPKINSQKLVSGYLYVDAKSLVVKKIELQGKIDFYSFKGEVDFGDENKYYMLPVSSKLELKFNVLGNEMVRKCSFYFKYKNIKIVETAPPKTKRLILPNVIMKLDSIPFVADSSFWCSKRPVPLTEEEKKIEQAQIFRRETSMKLKVDKNSNSIDFVSAVDAVSAQRFESSAFTFRYSGVVNPFKLSYGGLDGFVYWQQLNLDKKTKSSKFLSLRPSVGYVFKRKELFITVPFNYTFFPKKFGTLSATLGNRNNSYSSKTIALINQEISNKDSVNFKKLNLKYYKHYYLSLRAQYEIFNGLILSGGLDYLLYKPVRDSSRYSNSFGGREVDRLVNHNYISFSPVLQLTWTPDMYYNYNGDQKIYIGSKFPTFSLEYSRGIKGLFGGNSLYERIEGDVQQKIRLGLLRSFQYYFGFGLFTNERSVYFADFNRFQKNNFPKSWDDGIGGVFQLLENNWYNSSNKYVQLHAMYEAPFFLLPLFKRIPIDIVKERLYFSQLYTKSLPNYTEIGYGVGNYIFNLGLFVNLNKGQFDSVGAKFAFEIN